VVPLEATHSEIKEKEIILDIHVMNSLKAKNRNVADFHSKMSTSKAL
jgi:hypothetical protein